MSEFQHQDYSDGKGVHFKSGVRQLGIFIGSVILVSILISSLFWVTTVLVDSQEKTNTFVIPVTEQIKSINSSVADIFQQQSNASNSKSLEELLHLKSSKKPSQHLKALINELEHFYHSNPDKEESGMKILKDVRFSLDNLVETNANYLVSTEKILSLKKDFEATQTNIKKLIKDMVESCLSISGQVRFKHRRKVRKLKQSLNKGGYNNELKLKIDQVLFGNEAKRQKLVTDIIVHAQTIGREASEIGSIQNKDSLTSLHGNRIIQTRQALERILDASLDAFKDDDRILKKVSDLKVKFNQAYFMIADEQNPKSLYSKKQHLFEELKHAELIRQKSRKASLDFTLKISQFDRNIKSVSKKYQTTSQTIAQNTVLATTILGILGLIGALAAGHQVRKSMAELKETNQNLVDMSTQVTRLLNTVEEKNIELKSINQSLEQKVQERTATIKLIVDNVKAGFLLINQDLEIQEGFTRSCHEIFQKELASGDNLLKALELEGSTEDHVWCCIEQVFMDTLPESVALNQIPKRFNLNGKVLSLAGSIIRNGDEEVEKILFTINDITRLEQEELKNRENQSLLMILSNTQTFQSFISRFRKDLDYLPLDDQSDRRIFIHTLKGNLMIFGMADQVKLVHEIEEHKAITQDHINDIKNNIEEFLEEHFNLLRISKDEDPDQIIRLRKSDIAFLHTGIKNRDSSPQILQFVSKWGDHIAEKSIMDRLGPLHSSFKQLTKRLGKKAQLTIEGGDLKCSSRFAPVISCITHAIRNAITHGIEREARRGDKPSTGTVTLKFSQNEDEFSILIQDDGRGIDPDQIARSATIQGLIKESEVQSMSTKEKHYLIFRQGFSTSDGVDHISGRGVGMEALKRAVEDIGGQLDVDSTVGVGTRIDIKIPVDVNQEHTLPFQKWSA